MGCLKLPSASVLQAPSGPNQCSLQLGHSTYSSCLIVCKHLGQTGSPHVHVEEIGTHSEINSQ